MTEPPRQDVRPADEYFYRRPLKLRELAPAIGAGVGAGLVAFYLAKLFLERTPLRAAATSQAAADRRRDDD